MDRFRSTRVKGLFIILLVAIIGAIVGVSLVVARDSSKETYSKDLVAVRLGLSQALVGSRGSSGLGSQFLFLDEPFPSSDRNRAFEFGKLLRELGGFAQIFVTTQAPDEMPAAYDLVVETNLEMTHLEVGGKTGEAPIAAPAPLAAEPSEPQDA